METAGPYARSFASVGLIMLIAFSEKLKKKTPLLKDKKKT